MTAYPLQYLVLSVAVHGQGHYLLYNFFTVEGRVLAILFIYIYIYIYIYSCLNIFIYGIKVCSRRLVICEISRSQLVKSIHILLQLIITACRLGFF